MIVRGFRNLAFFLKAVTSIKDVSYLTAMSVAAAVTGLVIAMLLRSLTAKTTLGVITDNDIFLIVVSILAGALPIFLTRDDVSKAMLLCKEESVLATLRSLAPWRGEPSLERFIAYAVKHTGKRASLHSVLTVVRQELLPIDRQEVTIELLQSQDCMLDYLNNVFVRSNVSDILSISPTGKQLQRMLNEKLLAKYEAAQMVEVVEAWSSRSQASGLRLVVDNTTANRAG